VTRIKKPPEYTQTACLLFVSLSTQWRGGGGEVYDGCSCSALRPGSISVSVSSWIACLALGDVQHALAIHRIVEQEFLRQHFQLVAVFFSSVRTVWCAPSTNRRTSCRSARPFLRCKRGYERQRVAEKRLMILIAEIEQPKASLMPNCATIRRAMFVTCRSRSMRRADFADGDFFSAAPAQPDDHHAGQEVFRIETAVVFRLEDGHAARLPARAIVTL